MGIINFGNRNNTTSINNDFIINHMPHLSGDLIKIYLYMLMQNNNGYDISIDEVSDTFGIFSNEIIKALTTLDSEGLCKFEKNGDNFSLSFDVTPKTNSPLGMSYSYKNNNQTTTINPSGQVMFNTNDMISSDRISTDNVLNFTNNVNNNQSKAISDYMNNSISFDNEYSEKFSTNYLDKKNEKERYSPEELAFLLQENDEVSDLKKYIEKTYGATFDPRTLETLVSICAMDYVPVSTLKTIVSYLSTNNTKIQKLNPLLNALEQKAIEINEKGLSSEEEINDYLTSTSQNYLAIARRFGIFGRGIAPAEKMFIDKWLYDYRMDLDIILNACDTTIRKTNKASFEYCDAIIKNYKDAGIKSLNDLNKPNAKVQKDNDNSIYKMPKKSGFNNYSNKDNLSQFEMDNLTKIMNKYGNK